MEDLTPNAPEHRDTEPERPSVPARVAHWKDFIDGQGLWTCISCGDCCRNIRGLLPLSYVRPDGACVNLLPDNKCAIYEDRPYICRVSNFPATDKQRAKACEWVRNEYGSSTKKAERSSLQPRGPTEECDSSS